MSTLLPGQPTDNIPHDVEIDRPPNVDEIGPGVLLQTLDGAKMGNAIVVAEIKLTGDITGMKEHLEKTDQKLWLVQTDFGNIMKLCDNEIHEFYGLGWQSDYDTWFDARLELIQRTVENHD